MVALYVVMTDFTAFKRSVSSFCALASEDANNSSS